MATDKKHAPNIDLSDVENYPNGRIKDNTGSGDGTPVNRLLYSDLHEFFAKIMRLANIPYSGLPDNEANGHQLVAAAIALAGKNDFLYSLSDVGGVIQIGTDLSILKDGELLLTKAGFNFTAQTNVKGTANAVYSVTAPSNFKTNDYVLLIKNGPTGFILHRLADANNIDTLVEESNYLKAASQSEEFDGTSSSKATTPYTNQLAFSRRVNGLDSAMFLATAARNGLLSKEDKAILDGLSDPIKNRGWFSGLDVGATSQIGQSLPKSGNIVSAVVTSAYSGVTSGRNSSVVTVTLQNPMIANNYYVRVFVESEGTLEIDNDLTCPVFKKISNTQFYLSFQETDPVAQNLKTHIEVVQI